MTTMRCCCLLLTAAALAPPPKKPTALKATDPLSQEELTKMRFEEATVPLSRLRLAIDTHAQVYNRTDVDEDFVVPET